MIAREFIANWRQVELSERSASQQHFLDLWALAGDATPAAMDPMGAEGGPADGLLNRARRPRLSDDN